MKPVLQTLAEAYLNRYHDLSGVCFLFPNKRCGIFLKKYLKEAGYPENFKLPKILTISEFVAIISGKKEVGKIDAIFTLYKCYCEILKKNFSESSQLEADFDSFRNWGEIVLSDFSLVDQYLVNPEEIFGNVRKFRELSSNFLTDDQKDVLKEYFGHEDFGDTSSFWKNFEDTSHLSPIRQRFLTLWQMMDELYVAFTSKLAEQKEALTGRLYREAAEKVKEKGQSVLKYKKIVVFGFNALNGAELYLFSKFKTFQGVPGFDNFVDFIWDATGPVLTSSDNSASKFILSNLRRFPSPEWLEPYLEESNTDAYPDIKIVSSPSNTMQVKIAGEIIGERIRERDKTPELSDMALVLPDESLMSVTLSSLPVDTVNVTMGYSFRQTVVANFINLYRRLYANMRISHGDKLFYHKDLKIFLSHPYVYLLFSAEEINSLFEYIDTYHKITVSLEEMKHYLTDPQICFDPPQSSEKMQSSELESGILSYLSEILTTISDNLSNPSEENEEKNNLEISFINLYLENLKLLQDSLITHEMNVSQMGKLYLLDRIIGNTRLSFEGEPLEGLQVMGTLETRGLDFKEVVITSMNEGMMPRRARMRSFIPETLRKGYGLPPARYSEEIFAYYFYRLISRAERVTLIYDSRSSGGVKKGGESRYLLQLRYLAPKNVIKEEKWNFTLSSKATDVASVVKTPEIQELLQPYLQESGKKKSFSASALNNYRECEVFFFLRRLLDINPDPVNPETIDAITVGNVLHDVMMNLYLPHDLQRKLLESPVIIDKDKIEGILANSNVIKSLIVKKINKDFYHFEKPYLDTPLPVSTEIVAEQLLLQIQEILRYDLKLAPFKLYGCEISDELRITIESGKTVNFTFAIDRLDAIEYEGKERLRIVDYKTGKRKREAKNLEEVLRGDYRSEQVFQLFLYAWLLSRYNMPGKDEVMTEIYFVPDLITGKGGLPKIGKKFVKSYKEYAEEFDKGIQQMVNEIFDSDTFREPLSSETCGFCAFKQICGK